MAVIATDTFTRANESPLASPWQSTTKNNFLLSSNAVVPNGLGSDSMMFHNATVPVNQYTQCVVSGVTGGTAGGEQGIGVACRVTAAANAYGFFVNQAATSNFTVVRWNTGTYNLITKFTGTYTSGMTIRLEVTGTGAGIVLRCYVNGVQVGGDISDIAGTHIDAAGNAGIVYSSVLSAGTIDNWETGDFTSATSMLVPHHPHGMGAGRW